MTPPKFSILHPNYPFSIIHSQFSITKQTLKGNTMKFTLIYGKDDGWYVGRLQEIPGVISQGETLEELKENIADAYRLLVEDAMELPVPELHTEEINLNIA